MVSLVKQQHNDIGYFGYKKTYPHMPKTFYWKKMLKHLCQIVGACDLCQKSKISRGMKGEFNTIICKTLGDLATLDFVGPLSPSRPGVTQVLVVVDAFSRFTKLYALKRTSAGIVVNKLVNDYLVNMKLPRAILSDNGTQFHVHVYKNAPKERDIQVKYTSLYFSLFP